MNEVDLFFDRVRPMYEPVKEKDCQAEAGQRSDVHKLPKTYGKKIVVKLDLQDAKEGMEAAVKKCAALPGIWSISMDIEQKELTVIGNVDPVALVKKLHKYRCQLITVGPAKDPEFTLSVGYKEQYGKEKPREEGNGGGELNKEEGKKADSASDTDATGSENRGADYNGKRLGNRVFDLEKEVEGKGILLLFGEDSEFEKEMLIELWMALGVLTEEPMEVIGTNFFEKLMFEGYILWSVANSLYKVNNAKLDSELDMITERRKYAMLDNGSRNVAASTETLHVSVVCDEIDESIFTTLGRFNKLRVLFLRNYGSRLQEVPRDIFLCYESLVALDLSGAHIKELPSSAEKMIQLRFIDLSWTFIELLPERIDHFKKLQTLKLKGCSRLHRLPKELKVLTELRYLDVDVLGQLASFPEGIGALVNLRTLPAFPVGIEEGLKISELKYLDNLTGEFCIAKLENVQSAEEAKGALLTAKRSIKKLELRWSDHQFQEKKNEVEAILENLCPCSELEEILILCYPGASFPSWITDVSFHKLVSITLFRCVHVSVLPLLQKLPELASLELISLNSVVDVSFKGEVGDVAFPKLQKLGVDEMLTLESWAEAQEDDYPCLINVSIRDCPKLPELPSLPYLPSIENLEVSGCTELAFVSEKVLSLSL